MGKSQQELANLLGRDKRTVQKWEKGEIRVTMEDFCAVLDALNLPDELYFRWVCHPELFPNGVEDLKKLDPDGPQPLMEVLEACYDASAVSVERGDNRYSIGGVGMTPEKKEEDPKP